MTANSLTLPCLPGPSRPARRWLRIPDFLLREDEAPRDRSKLRAEKQLEKSARRGHHIVLGTPELPYDPMALGDAPLAALRRFDGLAITVTTRSPEILEHLELLIELDQSHAVEVDVLVACSADGGPADSFEPDLEERLRAVAALAAQGITTRLVVTDLPAHPSPENAAQVRRLVEAAAERRAYDVAVASRNGTDDGEWSLLLSRLRLECGFPHVVPGRG